MMRPRRQRGGQALAELAIFGSIMLVALAAMVRIGMRYSYAQQAGQEAFRRSLRAAHDSQPSGQGSVRVAYDRYLPDASHPFGLGQTGLITGSGSVTWGNRMQVHQIDLEAEIPKEKVWLDGLNWEFTRGVFHAWVAQPATTWRRLARIFCDPDADTQDEFDACDAYLRRHVYPIQAGEIYLPTRNMYVQVVGLSLASTFPAQAIIVLDPCGGDFNDAETCRRQCLKLKCGPSARTSFQIAQCFATNTNLLPQPGYCPDLLDPVTFQELKDHPHGLDASRYVRTTAATGSVSGTVREQQIDITQAETTDDRMFRIQTPTSTRQYLQIHAPVMNAQRQRSRARKWTTP